MNYRSLILASFFAGSALLAQSAAAASVEQGRNLSSRLAGSKAAVDNPAFGRALGLGASEGLELVSRHTTDTGRDIARYRQSFAGVPVWGRQLIVERDAAGAVTRLKGELVSDLAGNLQGVRPSVPGPEALESMRERVAAGLGSNPVFSREKSELVIHVGDDGAVNLAWKLEFLADSEDGGHPTRPIFLVDAVDGRVLQSFDALTHLCSSGCELLNEGGLSQSRRKWLYGYSVTMPSDAPTGSNLVISISGGSGDADLYVRKGANPTSSSYDCRPYLSGNNESCTVKANPGEVWYIGIYAYSSFSGLSLNASVAVVVAGYLGEGPGGNQKIGEKFYNGLVGGNNFPKLLIQKQNSNCTMNNANVKTVDLNGATTGSTAFSYLADEQNVCFNDADPANGAFSPLNDAHYFGGVVFDMYQAYLNTAPLTFQLSMRVHYGTNYENAFWDGSAMTFGDGGSTFYPLVSLDVSAHEVSHGFTEQNSNLTYSGQSGGMNESFSDMAGEAAEYFSRGSADFLVGFDILKGATSALRSMCNPPADGRSIDNIASYTGGLDVHYSSGVYNKAFCTLAKTSGWTVEKAFVAFANANRYCWTSSTGFVAGAQCVVDEASQADRAAIAAAFAVVGITGLVTAPPEAPILAAPSTTDVSYNTVSLHWNDVADEDGYRIERSTGGAAFEPIATLAAGSTAYNDGSVSDSTTYSYRVVAYNSAGGNTSNTQAVTTPAAPPASISLSVSTSIFKRTNRRVTLTWSGATTNNVDIYRDGTLITTTANDGSHTDQPGTTSSTYVYKVCHAGSTTVCSPEVTAQF